jgi:hypothetical protein
MKPRPYLRPALLAAGPSFFSGLKTSISSPISVSPHHVPLHINRGIRPLISAANARYNRGIVRRTPIHAFHERHHNVRLAPGGGITTNPAKSRLDKLHKIRKAWN